IGLGIVEKKPTSKKDRSAVQAAFNAWGEESGLPLCHMSMILARSIG
ncbi:MAG: DNA-3-methyladenine glycosylase I, partial [Rhodospirillaceae bacterium]|nr:DNA-3-methyladenine glycosylase I [Rhodospirillaceae bacterium]